MREAISLRLRFEILKRDDFKCQYCGTRACRGDVELHADHIIPISRGGETNGTNLIAACRSCNAGKSDRVLAGLFVEKLLLRNAMLSKYVQVPEHCLWEALESVIIPDNIEQLRYRLKNGEFKGWLEFMEACHQTSIDEAEFFRSTRSKPIEKDEEFINSDEVLQ